jgi:hypothetical protein
MNHRLLGQSQSLSDIHFAPDASSPVDAFLLRSQGSWIKLLYIPAACTHLFQTVDRGLAALVKSSMRREFQVWVTQQVITSLRSGTEPTNLTVDFKVDNVKPLLTKCFGNALRNAHAQPTKILRYWELTGLMQAYDDVNIPEAVINLQRLFPKLDVTENGNKRRFRGIAVENPEFVEDEYVEDEYVEGTIPSVPTDNADDPDPSDWHGARATWRAAERSRGVGPHD